MIDGFLAFLGLFLGAALGQFTVALGWLAAVAAIVSGYCRAGWFSIQLIGAIGGLVAVFVFKGTAVDMKMGGLAGKMGFNLIVYMLIGCVGYALGWVVMRILRKGAED